eukprot:s716_g17.t1
MLRGVALLGPAGSGPEEPAVQTLAALPRKEELPEDDQQLLQTLPKVLLHRRSSSAWKLLCGTTRCFCTVVAEFSMRFYVSALRFCLGQDAEEEVCTCFWSEHPEAISATFVKSLARLTATAIKPGTNLHDPDYLAKLWVWLLSEVPLPPPTCSLHLCARHGASALAVGAMAQIDCLPVPHVPLGYLVQRLSLSSLLLLFRLALLERKVVLRSSSAFTLAACGEAITSLLLFPFRWQHTYVPVSPVKREHLQQKGPYVLGLHREVLDLGTAALTALPSRTSGGSCTFSVFDLDVGEVEMESAAGRLPELPSSIQARLRAGVSRLMANSGVDAGAASQTRLGEGDPTFDREVQKVFFHCVAPLVTDLRQFYTQPEDGVVAGCFDVHAYVHSREPEAQVFARALSQTVAFRELLQETMSLPTGDSVLEKALVQEQLQPSPPVEGNSAAALGRAATDHATDSFQSVPRSSFASCPPDLPEDASSLTGQASLYLGQGGRQGARPVELQLSFAPEAPEASNSVAVASSRTHVATWHRAGLARDKGEFQGQSAAAPCSSFVDAFVAAVKSQAQLVSESAQGRSYSWAPKLLSAFATSEASARLPKHQREMLEHFLEGYAAGADGCASAARSASAAGPVKQPVILVADRPGFLRHTLSCNEILREEWLVRIMRDGCSLEDAPADLRGDRNFVLEAVHRTRASWLGKLASKSLQVDKDFLSECSRLAGSGLIFTYYSPTCFPNMRLRFQISGASIPGGQAYDQVSRNMKRESGDKGISTVWFGEKLVWGHTADLGDWVHPNHDCGRDQVPLPNFSEQDAKWRSMVESRSETCYPEVGRSYICWCCHWLRLVRERQQEGKVMCCTVSNIFKPEWVALYGAGSSEVSDATADELGLPRSLVCWRAIFGGLSMCNVLPSCFARGREMETVTQRLGEVESDRELLAEFEEVEAVEMPVLNMLNRCLKTPRHPCLVAVDLLRRAFMCLQAVQSEDMQREAVRHAGTDGGGKRVRFSRTAPSISVAPSEEGEHLSPLRGGRRPRRSATLASLSVSPSLSVSVSPSRSFGPRSPLAISPERTSERSRKQGRSSDPNVLSSTSHLSPTRPRVEAGESEPSPLVAELRRRFGELQACHPAELTHEEKLAFWLNVLNASTLAWLCVVGARNLHSNLFPMHVWSSFLQRSMVNVGGQEKHGVPEVCPLKF